MKHVMVMAGLTATAYYLGTKLRGYQPTSLWEEALVPFDSGQRWTPPLNEPSHTPRDLTLKGWEYRNPANWHIDEEEF